MHRHRPPMMHSMPTPKTPRKFKGFAVLDRGGKLVWGTISMGRADALQTYRKWNPDPTGQGMGEMVVQIEMILKN